MKKIAFHWQIIFAILLATVIGSIVGTTSHLFGITYYSLFNFFGKLFLNALKMLIVPLIATSIIVGVSELGNTNNLRRLGGKTLIFYLVSSLLAIIVGLILVNIIHPGIINGKPVGTTHLNISSSLTSTVINKISNHNVSDIAEIFLRIIPANIIEAAAQGKMLGLIFFSFLFGFFMTKIDSKGHKVLHDFWQSIFDTMMHITQWVMKFSPYGIFALVAKNVASTGFSAFKPLLAFFFTVIIALFIHVFFTLFLLLRIVGRRNPIKHLKIMLPVLLTAFSTASSSATLPITLKVVENKAGISNRITSFVIPLGATINMDGTALYECVAALFIAQAYGVDLSTIQQLLIVIIALLTSIGVAGIPAASLVAISVILSAIGLPIESIGLLLITDRFLDMCRTAVNVFSDSCGAVIIAKTEKEHTKIIASNSSH